MQKHPCGEGVAVCNGFSFSMVSRFALHNGVPVFGSRLFIRCATESSVDRFRHCITADQLLYLSLQLL